jgi:hypothetical protein
MKMFWRNFLTAFPAIIFFGLSVLAQGGVQSNVVRDAASGLSFVIPAGWTSEEADGGFILTSDAKTAKIVVKAHSYNDFESFVEAEVDLEKSGFKQSGPVYDLGGGNRSVRVYKTANGKNIIIDTIFLLSANGGGAIVMSLTTDAETAKQSLNAAVGVVKSLRFGRPQPAPQNSGVQAAFGGKKLSYFYTGNGYSENRTIWLCASGAYFSKSESVSLSALGSGATSGGDQGTWQIQQRGGAAVLILRSQRGGQGEYEISRRQANNEIGLNGKRYFVETHNECR